MKTPSEWAAESEIFKAYVDSAKTYIQLSSGGLALPILLHEKLSTLRASAALRGTSATAWIVVCATWLLFLVSIGSGAFYQFVAAKYIEKVIDHDAYLPRFLQPVIDRGPGDFYTVALVSFYAGAIGVVAYSILLLRS